MFFIAGHINMVGGSSCSGTGRGGGRKAGRRGRGGTTKPLNVVIQAVEKRQQEERGEGSRVGGSSRGTGGRPPMRKRRGGGRGGEETEGEGGRGEERVEEMERDGCETEIPSADGSDFEEEGCEKEVSNDVYLRGPVALPKSVPLEQRPLVEPDGST